ncbi:exodeoxyribonuclease V subunit alpha [Actinobacillus equuli subsp. haemolyticus]|uniref:exodeoxyribonuclease V subunit alpha n=1 Tax=Actinobacillus equuli TaxID=718 RepID=UPI002443348B|nr:exodeoxyribonuclease V subunit alpha [Actinobacillus equuli]WGE77543.1 exodeoxyribonuclease V subunit alpha [Actinobacillus equuli subsp. haemolyticus]
MLTLLETLKAENHLSELNYQFAKMIAHKQQAYNYNEQQQNLAILLAALLSYHVMQGHTALRLDSNAAQSFFGLEHKKLGHDFQSEILQKIGGISPLEWQDILHEHIAFSHSPMQIAPMLFQHGLLYFYRYWQAEHNIARYLQQAIEFPGEFANTDLDKQILSELFPEKTMEIDWQKIAVATALRQRFCVISGGPGTGKTTTVAKLLVALQTRQYRQQKSALNIAPVAPTGKAAARLKESISNSFEKMQLTFEIPTYASTIHRLLGVRPNSDTPTYHVKNPLHLDLLVVDEASMIDLSLMEKLMNALKPSTRLIILGDKDQLASVEVGAIMGELGEFVQLGYSSAHCEYLYKVTGYSLSEQSNVLPICDTLCHLQKSHRFSEYSGIGQLAALVNQQKENESWRIFTKSQTDLVCIKYPSTTQFAEKRQWVQHCVNLVVEKAVEHYQVYLKLVQQRIGNPDKVSVNEIFEAFQKVRFLSALRVSELGSDRLNQSIAEALRKARLLNFTFSRDSYAGKPILITQNSPENNIYSGDIGIILPDEHNQLRVYFDTKVENTHLSLSLSRLPEHEVAYVMTVHKSQGSEFEHTFFIMPLNSAPVITKELIYTAVTRAKQTFTLFSEEKVWKIGVRANVQRQSGLQAQLKNMFS